MERREAAEESKPEEEERSRFMDGWEALIERGGDEVMESRLMMPSMWSMLVSNVNVLVVLVMGESGEGGCECEDEDFFFLRFRNEDGGGGAKERVLRSGMGGGGTRREGCSASNASVLSALLDRLLSLLNTEDLTFLIWLTLALAVRAVAARKVELELSRRSRCDKGLSSSAEWRLVLLPSMDMLSVL